jgi:hypothetical protein
VLFVPLCGYFFGSVLFNHGLTAGGASMARRHGNAGVFCAGLSALTRCAFKNPARWAGLLCRRGSTLVAASGRRDLSRRPFAGAGVGGDINWQTVVFRARKPHFKNTSSFSANLCDQLNGKCSI